MPSQSKPNVNTVWASAGLATPVDPSKQALGYVAEIPDYDDFNGNLQQISAFLKHTNQEGIPVWDAATAYFVKGLTKSPIDGEVYRAVADNTNAPPVTTVGGAVNAAWELYGGATATQAEATAGTNNAKRMTPLRVFQAIAAVVVQATEAAFGWAKIASSAQITAGTDNNTIVTPLKLRLVTGSIMVSHVVAQNTAANSTGIGANIRVLNTLDNNTIAGASLSANQVTLPPGRYKVRGYGIVFADQFGSYLWNVTDSTTAVKGLSMQGTDPGSPDKSTPPALVEGYMTLAGTKVFELRHWINTLTTNVGAMGQPNNQSIQGAEVYAILEIRSVP